jgi:protein-disulfide isomerase
VETEPALIEQYIQTGKARLVYRHLIQLGATSLALGEASECAGAQGKFWEARDQIYRRQRELAGANTFAKLEPLVTDLGLDAPQFQTCFDQHEYRKQVQDDAAAAERAGIRSRPVFDIAGTRLIGAQSLAEFQRVLDRTP